MVGYSVIKSVAAGMKKAKSTDTEKLVAAFKGLQVDTPFGKVTFRPEDHQSTMGAYVGRTKNEGGKGVMVDCRYVDGAKFLPAAAEVKKSARRQLTSSPHFCRTQPLRARWRPHGVTAPFDTLRILQ